MLGRIFSLFCSETTICDFFSFPAKWVPSENDLLQKRRFCYQEAILLYKIGSLLNREGKTFWHVPLCKWLYPSKHKHKVLRHNFNRKVSFPLCSECFCFLFFFSKTLLLTRYLFHRRSLLGRNQSLKVDKWRSCGIFMMKNAPIPTRTM